MSLVTVENLVFEYPGCRALKNITLSVTKSQIVALVGPNGAGKTTLLRCISALETPLSGRISVAGHDVAHEPRAVHARVGYLSDYFGLYDDLSVRQSLWYRAGAQGLPRGTRTDAVEWASGLLHLRHFIASRIGTLSRGQRQRVGIAHALIHKPMLLILDEPASGLDPEARADLSAVLRRLAGEGITIVVSSHILSELEDYCTHMVILRDGQITDVRALKDHEGTLRANMAVMLSTPDARLAPMIAEFPETSGLSEDGLTVRFQMSGKAEEQAKLLKLLVDAGLPVCNLQREVERLQDLYLRQTAALHTSQEQSADAIS